MPNHQTFNCWALQKLRIPLLAVGIAISCNLCCEENQANAVEEPPSFQAPPSNAQPSPSSSSDNPTMKPPAPNGQQPAENAQQEQQEKSEQDTPSTPQVPPKIPTRDKGERDSGDPRPRTAEKPKKPSAPKTVRMKVWRKSKVSDEK